MNSRISTVYPFGLKKGFWLKLSEGYQLQQKNPEEG